MKEAYPTTWSLAAIADYLAHPTAPFLLHQERVFNYWRLRFKNRCVFIKTIRRPGKELFSLAAYAA
ncbi:hypothetical protein V9K67_25420 [Paraflavisolibacter sp. H34]|uniref:hypothetical protein n=1 Tax=Huijunlia imazamoxiresistens TaxID=3127457 RepID=UPI003019ED30